MPAMSLPQSLYNLPLATEDREAAGSITGHDVIGWKELLDKE